VTGWESRSLPERLSMKSRPEGRLFSFPTLGRLRVPGYATRAMPKALEPRPTGGKHAPSRPGLPRDVIDELRRTSKPGRADDAIRSVERATLLLERGDLRGAFREVERAKVAAPRSATIRELRGIALYRHDRWREALTELRAYKRMTGRADENHLIADCERALGRPDRAVPLAEEALRAKVPNDVKAESVIVAASALADLGRFEEALAMLRRLRAKDDVAREYAMRIWYVTGEVLTRLGRDGEAAEEFRRIVRYDAGAFDAAERLAALGGR
jgi:tetratricopeptide (TPR) repeat protein